MLIEKQSGGELGQAIRSFRRVFYAVGAFSFAINLLLLVPAIYMLQIYDRVLSSRNEVTLLMLTLIMVGLYVLEAALELVRSKALIRATCAGVIPSSVGSVPASFATPTIVHFCVALLLSALLRAPWKEIALVAAFWGLIGACGIVYAVIVTRRMRGQTVYQPEFEDWLFHALLPFTAYSILTLSAFAASSLKR